MDVKFFRRNFFVGIFSSEFFRQNFFVGIFSSEFFRPNFFRPSSVRRPSVRRPFVRRPSIVRPSDDDARRRAGAKPPQESTLPVPCLRGSLWARNLRYPRLALAAEEAALRQVQEEEKALQTHTCPVCGKPMASEGMQEHVDECLTQLVAHVQSSVSNIPGVDSLQRLGQLVQAWGTEQKQSSVGVASLPARKFGQLPPKEPVSQPLPPSAQFFTGAAARHAAAGLT